MPYILNKTNGNKLVTLQDASLDISTSLTFVGRNYSGYGEVFNENFLKLLENFSNTTQPAKPIQGQLWYDNVNNQIKISRDGRTFQGIANLTVKSTSTPDNPSVGDLWWDTANNQLSAFDGSTFILVGPSDPSTARASWVPAEEVDAVTNTSFPVIKGKFGSDIIVIFSKVSDEISSISPSSSDLTAGSKFGNGIKKGITLAGTNSSGSSKENGYYFWGTASDSLRSTTATNVTVSSSTSGVYYLTFASAQTGDRALVTDTDLSYNASTNVLNVTATSARYADLAEKYRADRSYPPGTVITVGGTAEVTASKEGDRAIGVISMYPAYLMNEGLADGIPVALKGRVPVRILGSVRKGDRLVAADHGCARSTPPGHPDVFAIALADSEPNAVFVEAVIL